QMIVGLAPRMIKICLVLILVGNITLALAMTGMNMFVMRANTGSVVKAAEIIKKYAKPGDIIITPTNLQIHFDFLGLWRVADGSLISTKARRFGGGPRAIGPGNKPLGPSLRSGPRQNIHSAMDDLIEKEINTEAIERYKTIRQGELPDAFLNDLFIWSQPDRSILWIEKWDEMVQFDTNRIQLEKLDEVEVPLRVYGMPGAGPGPGPGMGQGQGPGSRRMRPGPGGRMGPPPGSPSSHGPLGIPSQGKYGRPDNPPEDSFDPDHVQPNIPQNGQNGPRRPRPALGMGLSEETETMAVARVRLLMN
ncbi:hypothetical protein K8I31_06255, partial [bacterium]|nr:hypothetical protein [bacterium]